MKREVMNAGGYLHCVIGKGEQQKDCEEASWAVAVEAFVVVVVKVTWYPANLVFL